MSHHVGEVTSDGTSVYADYRQPIIHVMRRQLARVQDCQPRDQGDMDLITEWAAACPEQTCQVPFDACTHPPASREPFRAAPYKRPATGGLW